MLDRMRVLEATELLDSPTERSFDRLTALAAKLIGAPVALVSLVDERRQFFKSAFGLLKEPWASKRETPLSHSFCQYVVSEKSALVVDDAREHPLVRDNLAVRDLDVVAYAGMPMIVEGEAVGAFCVVDDKPRSWSEEQLQVLRDLADSVVTEIELRMALRASHRKEVALRHSEQVHRAILQHLPDGGVIMVDHDLRILAADGPVFAKVMQLANVDQLVGKTVMEVSSEANRASVVELYRAGLRGERRRDTVKRDGQSYDVDTVPIFDGDVVTHTMVFVRDVTVRAEELAELECARAALEKSAGELREASVTDELTGLLNRRGFTLIAEQQTKIAARSRQSLMLFFIDLDGMKGINDKLGHNMGDRALVDTATLLRSVFRSSDVIARLGGDEFVVLATDASQSNVIKARVQEALEQHRSGDAPFRLALSVGTSTFDPAAPTTIESMLADADARMYEAKRAAKNPQRIPDRRSLVPSAPV